MALRVPASIPSNILEFSEWARQALEEIVSAEIADDAVTDSEIRNSVALSVIGRASNTDGDPADIAAGANDTILRRVADTLVFGQLTAGMAPDALWPYAKLQDATANSVLGRAAGTDGVLADIALSADQFLVNRAGTLQGATIQDGDIPATIARDSEVSAAISALNLASGVYTPTRSAEANLDSNVTMSQAQVLRVGNTVTVSGRFTADPTLTATATSFEATLPIASNIGAAEDVAGTAFCGGIAGQGAEIIGVVANDTFKVQWIAGDITSKTWSYHLTYRII